MKKIIGAFTCLLVLCAAGSGWSKILYVKTDGSDNNNGLSWNLAVKTIQVAVGLADADADDQIWVAMGTYALSSRIVVDKAVSIYGGFAGWETNLSQRDWQNNVTTVDGQDTVNCFTVTADVNIDGFSIKSGFGVYDDYSTKGGGIYHLSSALTVANCNLTENQEVIEFGAAIYSKSNSSLFITRCDFTNNQAYYSGGAIYNTGGDLIVSGYTFTDNVSENDSGGAIYAHSESNITVTGCTFNSNRITIVRRK